MSSDLLETTPIDAPRPVDERRPKAARASTKLIFESALIVLSVLFAFAVSEWRDRVAEHHLARAALANFRREIEVNLASLERVQPKHKQFAERLAAAGSQADMGKTAFDVFVKTMPEGGLDTPPLHEAAWEVAASTSALRLLDYNVAAQLSETYQVQRATVLPTTHLLSERFLDPRNFDPAGRETMVRVHQMLINELAGQEAYLIETYRKTLQLLPAPDSAAVKKTSGS